MKKKWTMVGFVLLCFSSLSSILSLDAVSLNSYANKNTIKVIVYDTSHVNEKNGYSDGDLTTGAMGLADFMVDLSDKNLTDLIGISQLKVKDTKGKTQAIQNIDNLLLYLNDNKIDTLPSEIGDMTNVSVIFAKSNRLSSLPEEITDLKNLQAVYVDSNQIEEFPSQLFTFATFKRPVLNKIGLGSNQISLLPEEISELALLPLYHLNLSDNKIAEVPAGIGALKALRVLHLDGNLLTSIPEQIGDLSGLINKLYLNDNLLTSIPDEISNLPVQWIYLQNNKLTSIPQEFGKLKKTIEIYMSHNNLKTLPDELANIKTLKLLDISDNPIKSIPSKLKNKKGLKIID